MQPPRKPTGLDAEPQPDADPDSDQATTRLRTRLNQETAQIPWVELQPFFARGVVVWVAPGLDLVETAVAFTQDRAALVQAEMAAARIARVDAKQARDWLADDTTLWAVVVSPWVLVQEERHASSPADPLPRHH